MGSQGVLERALKEYSSVPKETLAGLRRYLQTHTHTHATGRTYTHTDTHPAQARILPFG
jgi:hypothetical protein